MTEKPPSKYKIVPTISGKFNIEKYTNLQELVDHNILNRKDTWREYTIDECFELKYITIVVDLETAQDAKERIDHIESSPIYVSNYD